MRTARSLIASRSIRGGRAWPGKTCWDTHPHGQNSWHTLVKTLPCCNYCMPRGAWMPRGCMTWQGMLGYTPPSVDRILDTRSWKHYLPAATIAGGNNVSLCVESIWWQAICVWMVMQNCQITALDFSHIIGMMEADQKHFSQMHVYFCLEKCLVVFHKTGMHSSRIRTARDP